MLGATHAVLRRGARRRRAGAQRAQYRARIWGSTIANEATLLGTDSLSNLQVACKQAPGERAKHALRRWHWLRQQISMGRVRLVHVRDADMPADFLTK